MVEARQAGAAAYRAGGRPSQNPHASGEPTLCRAWAEGFKRAYYGDGLRGQAL